MWNRIIQSLSFMFLGAFFGFACLIIADQLGFFIEKWSPEFMIIDNKKIHQEKINSEELAIKERPAFRDAGVDQTTPIIYNENWEEISPQMVTKPLNITQTLQVILGGYSFDPVVFVEKLEQLAAKSEICPESNLKTWTDCFGVYEFPWGDTYRGTWRSDKINGFGQVIKKNGDRYIGDFVNNKSDGCGIYVFADGETVAGFWQNGDLVEEQKRCKRLESG